MRINILLDEGSEITMICKSVADKLKLKTKPLTNPLQINGVGGVTAGYATKFATFGIRGVSEDNDFSQEVSAIVYQSPCNNLKPSYWNATDEIAFENIPFSATINDKVRMIIGVDWVKFHLSKDEREGKQAIARRTLLGWTAIGKMSLADSEHFKELQIDTNETDLPDMSNTLLVSCSRPKIHHDQLEANRLATILEEHKALHRNLDDWEDPLPKLTDEESYALKVNQSLLTTINMQRRD